MVFRYLFQEYGTSPHRGIAVRACAIIACMSARKMGQGTLFEGREVIDVPENESLDLILDQLKASPCGECKPGMPLIFGEGPAPSNIMLVGEGAGLDDVGPQRPFQGPSGVMLEKMMRSIGVRVSNCYTTNVIKCIPPRERNFSIEEIEACRPFLLRQILAVDPQMIIAFGALAAQTILRSRLSISNLRGRVFDFVINDRRIVLVPTFNPAYLMRVPEKKREAWEDLKRVREMMKNRDQGSGVGDQEV